MMHRRPKEKTRKWAQVMKMVCLKIEIGPPPKHCGFPLVPFKRHTKMGTCKKETPISGSPWAIKERPRMWLVFSTAGLVIYGLGVPAAASE